MNNRTNMDNFMFQFHGREDYHVKENYGLSSLQQARNNDPTIRGRRLFGGGDKSNMANYAGTCLAASMLIRSRPPKLVFVCVERKNFDKVISEITNSNYEITKDKFISLSEQLESADREGYPVSCLGPIPKELAESLANLGLVTQIFDNINSCQKLCRFVLITLNIRLTHFVGNGGIVEDEPPAMEFGLYLPPNTNGNTIVTRVREIIRNGINNNNLEDVRGYEHFAEFLEDFYNQRTEPEHESELDTIYINIRSSNVDENSSLPNRNMVLDINIVTREVLIYPPDPPPPDDHPQAQSRSIYYRVFTPSQGWNPRLGIVATEWRYDWGSPWTPVNNRVSQLRTAIANQLEVNVKYVNLVFRGTVLQDYGADTADGERTIDYYGIEENDTILVIVSETPLSHDELRRTLNEVQVTPG